LLAYRRCSVDRRELKSEGGQRRPLDMDRDEDSDLALDQDQGQASALSLIRNVE